MSAQQNVDRLTLREIGRQAIEDAIAGERSDLSIQPAVLTRYIKGDIANAVEVVLTLIDELPVARASIIAGAVADFFEHRHGRSIKDLDTELLEKHVADLEDDDVRYRLKNPDGTWNAAELRRLIRLSRVESKEAEDMRRAAMAELYHLNATRSMGEPSAWTTTRKEAVG